MRGLSLVGGIQPVIEDTDHMPILSSGHTGNALARPGTNSGTGTLSTGRIEYHPWIVRETIEIASVDVRVQTADATGLFDLGWYANRIDQGIWKPGGKLETIGTGLSLVATGTVSQAWPRTIRRGIYWTGLLALTIAGTGAVRTSAGYLSFVPQIGATAGHAIGYTESGLSALPANASPGLSGLQLASPALVYA